MAGWSTGGYGLPERYVEAVDRAGAQAVLVPAVSADADVLDAFDAVVLAGGGDLDPARFESAGHPSVYGVDPGRDALELAMARAAASKGMPTLAVCRGLQVVNVAFGGTLHLHLPDLDWAAAHGTPVGGGSVSHDVKIEPGSRLGSVCGPAASDCLSHHHQGVDRVGDGLVPVAWSDDGLVEGLELASPQGFYVAVQWHPEMTAASDPVQQALFNALVAAI